jgi:hypothetical protein
VATRSFSPTLSKRDSQLITDYAHYKGWRYGLVNAYQRLAIFYDENEKQVRKTFAELASELPAEPTDISSSKQGTK